MSTAALAQSPSLGLLPTTPLVGPVPPLAAPRRRPDLRVIDGGRAPERLARRAAYRRRRSVALALVATVAVALVLLVGAVSTRFAGGGDPSAAGASSPTSAVALRAAEVAASSWVVAPGDTLWSIAAEIAPDADVRMTVDQLVDLNGNDPIVVGQHLQLP